LAEALAELTPPPPRTMTGPEIRDLAATRRRRFFPVAHSRRVEVALVAAVLVVVVGSVVALVTWPDRSASTPPASESLNASLPAALSCPATAVTQDQQRAALAGATGLPSERLLEPHQIASTATQDQPSRDLLNLIVNPDGQPQWQVIGSGKRLPDEASARNYAILMMQAHGCGSHQKEIKPVGSASMATTRFFHKTYDGGYPGGGDRYIVALVGTDVLDYDVTGPNSNAAGPGDQFLVSLAAAARAKDLGQTVPPVAHPIVTPDPVPPAGFLSAAQLGTGWVNGNGLDDQPTITRADVAVSFCDVPTKSATGSGSAFTYRHSTGGSEDNVLTEQVLTLSTATEREVHAALAAAPAACKDSTVLFTNTTGTGDASVALRPASMTGWASVSMLSGSKLVVLTVLPGGAAGATTPLPGGTQWLSHVAEQAIANLSR
jgi:hypothetical protein